MSGVGTESQLRSAPHALLCMRYEGVDTNLDTVELNRPISTPRMSDYRDIVLSHASELDQGVWK